MGFYSPADDKIIVFWVPPSELVQSRDANWGLPVLDKEAGGAVFGTDSRLILNKGCQPEKQN